MSAKVDVPSGRGTGQLVDVVVGLRQAAGVDEGGDERWPEGESGERGDAISWTLKPPRLRRLQRSSSQIKRSQSSVRDRRLVTITMSLSLSSRLMALVMASVDSWSAQWTSFISATAGPCSWSRDHMFRSSRPLA